MVLAVLNMRVKHQHCGRTGWWTQVLPSPQFTPAQLAAELTGLINRPAPLAPNDQDCVLWSML
jgi:hypothetical protein